MFCSTFYVHSWSKREWGPTCTFIQHAIASKSLAPRHLSADVWLQRLASAPASQVCLFSLYAAQHDPAKVIRVFFFARVNDRCAVVFQKHKICLPENLHEQAMISWKHVSANATAESKRNALRDTMLDIHTLHLLRGSDSRREHWYVLAEASKLAGLGREETMEGMYTTADDVEAMQRVVSQVFGRDEVSVDAKTQWEESFENAVALTPWVRLNECVNGVQPCHAPLALQRMLTDYLALHQPEKLQDFLGTRNQWKHLDSVSAVIQSVRHMLESQCSPKAVLVFTNSTSFVGKTPLQQAVEVVMRDLIVAPASLLRMKERLSSMYQSLQPLPIAFLYRLALSSLYVSNHPNPYSSLHAQLAECMANAANSLLRALLGLPKESDVQLETRDSKRFWSQLHTLDLCIDLYQLHLGFEPMLSVLWNPTFLHIGHTELLQQAKDARDRLQRFHHG